MSFKPVLDSSSKDDHYNNRCACFRLLWFLMLSLVGCNIYKHKKLSQKTRMVCTIQKWFGTISLSVYNNIHMYVLVEFVSPSIIPILTYWNVSFFREWIFPADQGLGLQFSAHDLPTVLGRELLYWKAGKFYAEIHILKSMHVGKASNCVQTQMCTLLYFSQLWNGFNSSEF